MSAPFVGRRAELETLVGLVRRAVKARAPGAAIVIGEPGSGKTRLLAEVLDRESPARLVRVVGFEPNQSVPLAAVGDVIRNRTTPSARPSIETRAFPRA